MTTEAAGRAQTVQRVLEADPRRCTGCGMCRLICSMVKEGRAHAPLSRIGLIHCAGPQLHLPVICRHCEDAPCMAVCPRDAISRDSAAGRVMVDYDACISCKMCVAACPFGSMGYDPERRAVFKCDLCGGDPQCVRFCFPGALSYAPEQQQENLRARTAARQQLTGGKIRLKNAALQDRKARETTDRPNRFDPESGRQPG